MCEFHSCSAEKNLVLSAHCSSDLRYMQVLWDSMYYETPLTIMPH